MEIQQKITPFLWFNGNAEEAMNFYLSVFRNGKVGSVQRYPAGGPAPEGSVMSCTFELEGQRFMALNGGPQFSFTPAISFFVHCEDQAEVDYLWKELSEGGRKDRCGWLQDKFGVSWQIIPKALARLMHGADAIRSGRVMQAMLQMDKIDVPRLQAAYDGHDLID